MALYGVFKDELFLQARQIRPSRSAFGERGIDEAREPVGDFDRPDEDRLADNQGGDPDAAFGDIEPFDVPVVYLAWTVSTAGPLGRGDRLCSPAVGGFFLLSEDLEGSGLLHLAQPFGMLLLEPGPRHPAVKHRRERPGRADRP